MIVDSFIVFHGVDVSYAGNRSKRSDKKEKYSSYFSQWFGGVVWKSWNRKGNNMDNIKNKSLTNYKFETGLFKLTIEYTTQYIKQH